MADVIARAEESEAQLRAQLLDVKQQASSERSRLVTQMAEVEEKAVPSKPSAGYRYRMPRLKQWRRRQNLQNTSRRR